MERNGSLETRRGSKGGEAVSLFGRGGFVVAKWCVKGRSEDVATDAKVCKWTSTSHLLMQFQSTTMIACALKLFKDRWCSYGKLGAERLLPNTRALPLGRVGGIVLYIPHQDHCTNQCCNQSYCILVRLLNKYHSC